MQKRLPALCVLVMATGVSGALAATVPSRVTYPVTARAAAVLLGAQRGTDDARRRSTAAFRRGYDLAWSTYVGGPEREEGREVFVYPDGSVLVGLRSASSNMPVSAGAYQDFYAGDDPSGNPGLVGNDCYILRLGADGRNLIAATYFGGSKQERSTYGMAVDGSGNVYISSSTRSSDLPTTPGAFQRTFAGGSTDMFVAKLSADATTLLWSTYLGGSDNDSPRGGLAVDGQGFVYVVGGTFSADFPTTAGAHQTTLRGTQDVVILKLQPDGSGLAYSTFLGGSSTEVGLGIRVDSAGVVTVAGQTGSTDFPVVGSAPQRNNAGGTDAFMARLAAGGAALLSSTYLGGSGDEFTEHRIWLDNDLAIFTGFTASSDFPLAGGAFQTPYGAPADGFVASYGPQGNRVNWSTRIGGNGTDFWLAPTRDVAGNVYLVGSTASTDLPVTSHAIQSTYGGGNSDGALLVLSPDGQRLLYATYLGGGGEDIVRGLTIGPDGSLYLTGKTGSNDFPVSADAFQGSRGGLDDAFVARLKPRFKRSPVGSPGRSIRSRVGSTER